jgi:predicted GNAT superfamily acetyltransferase
MRRLGCICQIYLEDFYGEMDDQMSVGIESDRLQVEWWISSERVRERLTPSADSGPRRQDAQLLNPATLGLDGYPRPAGRPVELIGARLLVEIPSDMQAIRRADLALGISWRHHTRALLKSAFAAGYRVTDFIFERDSSPPRSFYLLEQMDADEVDRCRLGS